MTRLASWFFELAEKFLGAQKAEAAVRRFVGLTLGTPEIRRAVGGNLRRILRFAKGREPGEAEVAAAQEEMLDLYARTCVEYFRLPRDPAACAARAQTEFLEPLKRLLSGGRGVILASPHFGNESMIYGNVAALGIPVTVMINDAGSYQWPTRILETLKFIGLGDGAIEGLRALRNGGCLFLNTDLEFFPDAGTADLFGAPFHPPHGVARMAIAAGAPILPVYAVRQGDRHRCLCDDAIPPEAGQAAIETAILRSMERRIGRHPEQWFVFHDVWNLPAMRRELGGKLRAAWVRRRMALRLRA